MHDDYIGRMPIQQALFEDALRAASRLGGIIGEAAEERRARIRQITSFSTILMVLLALAALLSTYFVSRLGSQLQAHSRQLARRAEEERGLRELAQSLTATVDLEEVLQRIADGALYTGRAVGAHVERVFFDAEEIEVVAASGSGSPAVGTRIPYPGSLAEDVIERRAPEVIHNLAGENRPIARFLAESCSSCSALILPLISEDEALGALVLLREAKGSEWTRGEIERTQMLASLTAVALRRVLLLHAVQRHTEELEESERRFRLMVEGVRDYAIFMLTPGGRIASWNTGAERIMGYPAEEVLGEHFSTFYTPEDRAREWPDEELARAERLGRFEDQGWRVRRDGVRFWADTVLTAIRDEEGELVGFAKVTPDLTERKRVEEVRDQALEVARAAREDADAANQAKSQFLATMSHEIRTPINAIMGYTDLLDAEVSGPLTPAQRNQLGRIQASNRHLLTLINDILDLSKVEAGEMRTLAVPLRLRDTALAALSLIEPQAAAKGIEVQEEVACREDAAYVGDEDRVRQILVNLLSNAVKFTDSGRQIIIRCRVVDRPVRDARVDGSGPWAAIDVEDTGIGIPASQLGTIFDPFVQVDGAYTRQRGGTGLGLAISRRLARLMGGDITVRSVPEQGSTFTLWLPAVPREEETTPAEPLPWVREARDVGALGEIGRIIAENAEDLTRMVAERLRTDPQVPSAHALSTPELHDHMATFLVDIGRSLVTLHEDSSEPGLLRDSSEVQRLISDLHGRQRCRLGWSAEELHREFYIVDEEVEQLV